MKTYIFIFLISATLSIPSFAERFSLEVRRHLLNETSDKLRNIEFTQMREVQDAVNLAIERIEIGRRGCLGFSPALIAPFSDLLRAAFTSDAEFEPGILQTLFSPEFFDHSISLEQHIKHLRDTNAGREVIRDFELDLIRTRQLEDLMILNTNMGKSADLPRFAVLTLSGQGFLYSVYKGARFLVGYMRTKAAAPLAELNKPAQASRPASPKKYSKDPANIDFGIPKRLAGFDAGAGSQVALDAALPNHVEAPQELERQLQEVREYEIRQYELLKQQELRKREHEQHQLEREARERHEIEQDKLACWARAGHPWAKGGKQDLSFYYAIKSYLEEGRANGQSRETIIEVRWKEFKEEQHGNSGQKSHIAKALPKKTITPKQSTQATTHPAPAVRRNPWDNDNNALVPPRANTNNEIDWSEPVQKIESSKQGKRKSGGSSPKRSGNTLERAALNEYLFTEGALTWHANIEKRDPIQDEILEDVLWYSGLVLTNAIAENDALRRTAASFGEFQVDETGLQFTANDRDARVIRAHIVHGFRDPAQIERFAREVVIPYLGPRVKLYCDGENPEEFLVDLSLSELFEEREVALDVNDVIRNQFRRLARYVGYLMSKEQRMAHALRLLDEQNGGNAVFALGSIDYRLVDVFAARAIESVLVRLGELHHLYIEQAGENQTLPAEVVAFLRELNQKVRRKAAHEIDENHADWHFSPLSAEVVHQFMLAAIRLNEALKRA